MIINEKKQKRQSHLKSTCQNQFTMQTTGDRTNLAMGELEKIARYKKLENFISVFLKRPSFSGSDWKNKFIRASIDL